MSKKKYPVVDLFSGPGGLGEGFSAFRSEVENNQSSPFSVVVSVEKEKSARATLKVRSYYRQLLERGIPLDNYYAWLNSGIGEPIPVCDEEKQAMKIADEHARLHELGENDEADRELEQFIMQRASAGEMNEVPILIGGPPCQAYSLVGRARNQGNFEYKASEDHRHFLYKEYLRIVDLIKPAMFVMENVRGILSSKVDGKRIFPDILSDLVAPYVAMGKKDGCKYAIHSLVSDAVYREGDDPHEVDGRAYLIKSEEYGVPQKRHRVILLGIREDLNIAPEKLKKSHAKATVEGVISDLPRLRSRLSKGGDSPERWLQAIAQASNTLVNNLSRTTAYSDIVEEILRVSETGNRDALHTGGLRCNRGVNVVNGIKKMPESLLEWFADPMLEGVLNHETRGHIYQDLKRYLFVSAYGRVRRVSPKSGDFPRELAPKHINWNSGKFADRFRAQLANTASTTVTSHISKDGHYFIHPDPAQCRSLTVREAARLQTFPDNYIFMGNRTEQYVQVGNAVPPFLAYQIADIVYELLSKLKKEC